MSGDGRRYVYQGLALLLLACAAFVCGGCATAYNTGQRADGSRWRLLYVSVLWSKDFRTIDAANGTAGEMRSQPDGEEIAGAVVGAAVKAAVAP